MLQVPGWKLRGEVLGRDAFQELAPAWEDLCRRSVEDNVYYSPRYARALLDSVERDQGVALAVVWDGPMLLALLPFTRSNVAVPMLQPAAQAWHCKFITSCMPLLDRHRTMEAAEALVNVLASVSKAEWIIRFLNIEGETCRAMTAALRQKGLPCSFAGRFQRASLTADATFDEHMNQHVSAKRRKDIARNRRCLEKLGKVTHETHRCGEGLDRAIQAFLRIEAGGWKGRRGTALACDENTRKFAIEAFTGEQAHSICRADVLTLDGTAIAVSLVTLAGRTGFAVKCCYDEAYRKCGAGILLEVEVIRSFLTENWADRLDAATGGAHVIDNFWPGRVDVADLVFSLSPHYPRLRLSAFRLSDQVKRGIRAAIKRQVLRFRGS